MRTKKCIECGSQHYNKSEKSNYEEISDTCQNCTFLLRSFWSTVEALNRFVPSSGKPRKIKIISYKIEK